MYRDRNCRAGKVRSPCLGIVVVAAPLVWKAFPQVALYLSSPPPILYFSPLLSKMSFSSPSPHVKFHFIVTVGPASTCTPKQARIWGLSFHFHTSSHPPRAWHTGAQYMLREQDKTSHFSTLAQGRPWADAFPVRNRRHWPFAPSSATYGAVSPL